MKEQVSVEHINLYLEKCECKKYLCPKVLQEFERLKRLDENVKRKLYKIRTCDYGCEDWTWKEVIKLLESLDK